MKKNCESSAQISNHRKKCPFIAQRAKKAFLKTCSKRPVD